MQGTAGENLRVEKHAVAVVLEIHGKLNRSWVAEVVVATPAAGPGVQPFSLNAIQSLAPAPGFWGKARVRPIKARKRTSRRMVMCVILNLSRTCVVGRNWNSWGKGSLWWRWECGVVIVSEAETSSD